MDNTVTFEVHSDLTRVVLEISDEGAKSMKDSEPASLRALMAEFEEAQIVDTTICCHEFSRKPTNPDGT